MSSDGVILYNSTDAQRWVSEYERNEGELISYSARCREGRKPFVERRNSILDRAADAGIDRQALVNELKERALHRKIAEIAASEDADVALSRETLRERLGGLANLPLGEFVIENAKSAKAKGSSDFSGMTLDEAEAIVIEPKGKGRPSAAALSRRKAAEAVVSAAHAARDGASGDQAEAMAEAMGPDDNVTDLRPRFMQKPYDVASPPDLPPEAA